MYCIVCVSGRMSHCFLLSCNATFNEKRYIKWRIRNIIQDHFSSTQKLWDITKLWHLEIRHRKVHFKRELHFYDIKVMKLLSYHNGAWLYYSSYYFKLFGYTSSLCFSTIIYCELLMHMLWELLLSNVDLYITWHKQFEINQVVWEDLSSSHW